MRKITGLAALGLACASLGRLPTTPRGEVVLEVRGGALKGGPHRLGREDLARLPRRTVRGADPATGREQDYEGTPLRVLVEERVELTAGADIAVVRTADKAAVVVPLPIVRHLEPVLADRADGAPLPARVLAWPTAAQPGLARDPRAAAWWARDVNAIEVAEWRRTYGPALAPPEGAGDEARRGSAGYGGRCIGCHRMRGVGGDAGPDLTTVASRLGRARLLLLLERHPGWKAGETTGDPPDARDAEDLWSFLLAVAAGPGPGAR